MNMSLKKYLWQFAGIYTAIYTLGLIAAYFLNKVWHLGSADMLLVIALSASLPYYTAEKFVQNEKRYFSEEEQKRFVKKAALIVMGISIIPTGLVFGIISVIKMLATSQELSTFLANTSITTDEKTMFDLSQPILLAMIAGSLLLYYVLSRLALRGTFKRLAKTYAKKGLLTR